MLFYLYGSSDFLTVKRFKLKRDLKTENQYVFKCPEIMIRFSGTNYQYIGVVCKGFFACIFQIHIFESFVSETEFNTCAVSCNMKAVIHFLSEQKNIGLWN